MINDDGRKGNNDDDDHDYDEDDDDTITIVTMTVTKIIKAMMTIIRMRTRAMMATKVIMMKKVMTTMKKKMIRMMMAMIVMMTTMMMTKSTPRWAVNEEKSIPGRVRQHILRSSTWLSSSPINQEPRETSSFAYLCKIWLRQHHNSILI